LKAPSSCWAWCQRSTPEPPQQQASRVPQAHLQEKGLGSRFSGIRWLSNLIIFFIGSCK
jgi:hypothetical protein